MIGFLLQKKKKEKEMKSMNENSNNGCNNNNNSWLGFSLSPHMKMEVPSDPHQYHQPPSAPTSFFLSPHYNASEIFYADNAALSVMPLKSDGSLCIMEALSRSHTQGMVPSSSPKLEDFLGGATMAYGAHNAEPEPDRKRSPELFHRSARNHHQQQQQDQPQQQILMQSNSHQYFYGLIPSCDPQIPPMAPEEDEIPCFRNWVSQHIAGSPLVTDGGGSSSVTAVSCGELQSLSLTMSPVSQSSFALSGQISPAGAECAGVETKKRGAGKLCQKQPVHRKSIDTFGQRTSQYRGVTRHRWTGRYEAHLWDNSCKKEGQTRKGRQVYLGGYDMEEKAARAYDLAALKYWGPSTHINFPLENYQTELEEMKNMSRQEYVAHLRRKSSGFSRGASVFRGVTRHHQHGRWQARIGRVAGNKDLYLGTFSTQEEAAEAYDIAAIKFRGVNAVTNFDISRYDVERIMASNTLLAGELARRNKDLEPAPAPATDAVNPDAINAGDIDGHDWKMSLYQNQPTAGGYRNTAFSTALHDLIGIEPMNSNSHAAIEDDAGKQVTHFSNSSSLVTSLSSSREGSPEKTNGAMTPFGKPPASGAVSWYPSPAQLRPAAVLSHLPVFAGWNET